ncbi:hypothetical protein HanOQP8_Chr10g0360571 [Helianthus annuus]|nr:hypothetical protein HanOQP8_Chr10g0360571 [Helianthus annuus]
MFDSGINVRLMLIFFVFVLILWKFVDIVVVQGTGRRLGFHHHINLTLLSHCYCLLLFQIFMIYFKFIGSRLAEVTMIRSYTLREGLMSYKQFIQELEDDVLPSEAERRYQEYKSQYISTQNWMALLVTACKILIIFIFQPFLY